MLFLFSFSALHQLPELCVSGFWVSLLAHLFPFISDGYVMFHNGYFGFIIFHS
jgi:hypothetical protein